MVSFWLQTLLEFIMLFSFVGVIFVAIVLPMVVIYFAARDIDRKL